MALPRSRRTAKGQVSIPAEIRRKLGVAPGAVVEREDDGEQIVVRRAGRFSSEDIHRALFSSPPETKTFEELKKAVARRALKRNF